MAQTYCTREDVEASMGVAGVFACIDDDEDGVESVEESLHVTRAIERGAVEMNGSLGNQYVLSELANNDWCKWANVTLAAFFLRSRRNNPVESSVADAVIMIRENLAEARWGRFQVPEQSPSANHLPTVSTFRPELNKAFPIRVVVEDSTGEGPEGNLKRNTAYEPGRY